MPRKKKTSPIPKHKQYQTRVGLLGPSRKLNYLIGIMSLIVLVFASSTILKVMTGETTSLPVKTEYMRVQVLNGCGIPKAAAKTAEVIRDGCSPELAFDVIDEDNFDSFDVSESMIIMRTGQSKSHSTQLANILGVKPDNIVYQELDDNFLGIDLTVIVGEDFELIRDHKSKQQGS